MARILILKNYKILGIKAFERGEISSARTFFSLALNKRNKSQINFYLNLCDYIHIDADFCVAVFSYSQVVKMDKKSFDFFSNLIEVKISDTKSNANLSHDALDIADIKAICAHATKKDSNFSLNTLLLNAPIIIAGRANFLNFIEILAENGMKNLGFEIFEEAIERLGYDEKFKILSEKLRNEDKF